MSLALCPTHLGGVPGTSIVCGATLSPLTSIGLPFAKTKCCEAFTGAEVEHACPVLHLSLFLDILGIAVFMDAKNVVYFLLRR